MTGYSDPALRAETERLDAVHFEKPVDSTKLLSVVAGMLAGSGPTLHP